VSASDDKTIKIWEITDTLQQKYNFGHLGAVSSCDISRDGSWIISCTKPGPVGRRYSTVQVYRALLPEKIKATERLIKEKHQLMISYNWGHQSLVLKIAEALKKAGYNIWIDVEEMNGSTLGTMGKAVEESELILVCMSSLYQKSQACRTEGEYCYKLKKNIIPLMMEQFQPTEWLGALLGSKLYYPCTTEDEIKRNLPQIIKGIEINVPKSEDEIKKQEDEEKITDDIKNDEVKITINPPNPPCEQVQPRDWDIEKVLIWLKKIGLEDYALFFKVNEMNGRALQQLAKQTKYQFQAFEKACVQLNLFKLGHVLTFENELHYLFQIE
jgi:hypothetical protein